MRLLGNSMVELDEGIFIKQDMSEMFYIQDKGYFFPEMFQIPELRARYDELLAELKYLCSEEAMLEATFGPDWRKLYVESILKYDPGLEHMVHRFKVLKYAPDIAESLNLKPLNPPVLTKEQIRIDVSRILRADPVLKDDWNRFWLSVYAPDALKSV